MSQVDDALLAALPPEALDVNAPRLRAETRSAAAVIDLALLGADRARQEQDPALSAETFGDWLRNYALPDSCIVNATAAELKAQLLQKIASKGGQTADYMQQIAVQLGYTNVTITLYEPFTVTSRVSDPLYNESIRYLWQVNASLQGLLNFTVVSRVDEALQSNASNSLQCVLDNLKPAHTQVRVNLV